MGYFEELIGVNLWTALFTLLNTIAVIVVGTKFLFKPVMEMIQSRQQEIDDMYADAGKAQANAKAMEEEYQLKLSAAAETGDLLRQNRKQIPGQGAGEFHGRAHGGI